MTMPLTLPENPKQEIESFFSSFSSLLEANQTAISNSLDSYGVNSSDKQILLEALAASRQKINVELDQMQNIMQQDSSNSLATAFLTFANANNLPIDYQARVQACIQEQSHLRIQAAGDDAIPKLCQLMSISSAYSNLDATTGVVMKVCDAMLLAGTAGLVGAYIYDPSKVSTTFIAGALTDWATTCSAIQTQFAFVLFVPSIINDLIGKGPSLLLKVDPRSPIENQPAIITASLNVVNGEHCELLIKEGSEWITGKFSKFLVQLILKKGLVPRLINDIAEIISEDAAKRFQKYFEKALGSLFNPEQILKPITDLVKNICDEHGVPLPLDLKAGMLTPDPPPSGQLKFSSDSGHAEYTCPNDAESQEAKGYVFKVGKQICGDKWVFSNPENVICSPGIKLSPSSVSLSGEGGKSYTRESALFVKNIGEVQVDYLLQWSPQISNVNLSPMSGKLEAFASNTISASFSCPIEGGNWQGKIEARRAGSQTLGGISNVTLECSCEKKDCCGKCCSEGQIPPPCCPGQKCSDNNGDPHITTFDGLAYDFQGVGEFILMKSLVLSDTLEVQVRNRPWGNRKDVSITQAVAMKVAGDRVGFYAGMNPALRVNSAPTELAEGATITLPAGGEIVRQGSTYRVSWTDGSAVRIQDRGQNLDITMGLSTAKNGQVVGLLGNADDNRQNDVTTRDGTSLGTQIKFEDLYPNYADSWRVSQQESLFDYAPGETTETFTDRIFPRVRATVADLTEEVRARAEAICRAAGITDPILLDNCILDVALTGNAEFANISSDAVKPQEAATITPPLPPTINTPGFGQFSGEVMNAITFRWLNVAQIRLTMDGNPLPGVNVRNNYYEGYYESDVVPIGVGYQLDIEADGYIAEKVFALSALDRQVLYLGAARLVPVTAAGPGNITGHIVDKAGNNLPNMNVFARRYINQRSGNPIGVTVTDQNGNFVLRELEAGNYTLEFQREGYVTTYLPTVNIGGKTSHIGAILVDPHSAGNSWISHRIVLSWNEQSTDLDSHLTGPDSQNGRFHVYYGNRGDADSIIPPYAYLDRDDTSSFGSETIIIGKYLPGVYRYSIHDYTNRNSISSQKLADSGARVEVYDQDNRLIAWFTVPSQGGTLWTVFEIQFEADGSGGLINGRLDAIDHMSYVSNPENNSSVKTASNHWC